ncbi:MAG: DUF4080 domain-containing protein [Bdellovibrionaceae bacterium]|nr:DUF4080 domain-containing protein [Bdellovibrionales bacterium]MCB9086062.1 DUF4080 domain-containing protein [Pseudobdellovibrionaceae bacterium]
MIALCAVNATYQYPSLGIRSLLANMGELAGQTSLMEFSIKRDVEEIVEAILLARPAILGLGVYIWNVEHVTQICSQLRDCAPEIHIVLGGPEVSFEWGQHPICQFVDVVIQGEADLAFASHCRDYLSGRWSPKSGGAQVIPAALPDLSQLRMPYHLYTDSDLRNRHISVEASRGCPFKCQFCLSSLDRNVRSFPIDAFLDQMESLLNRGARNFKFIDRTFNLSPKVCDRILRFFLGHKDRGLFLHFEMVPDRLPSAVRELVAQFPEGSIQFEIGLQTLNEEVAHRIQRHNQWGKVVENFSFLTQKTHVHIHADLIAGLPGEDLKSFADGFDRLLALNPHEIQVGILKRLKGTPIAQHTEEWEMVYSRVAPYQVLRTRTMSFEDLLWISRFAKYWDRIYNRGLYPNVIKMLWELRDQRLHPSSFWQFMDLVRFMHRLHPTTYGLSQLAMVRSIVSYLRDIHRLPEHRVLESVATDYRAKGLRELPRFLRVPRGGA